VHTCVSITSKQYLQVSKQLWRWFISQQLWLVEISVLGAQLSVRFHHIPWPHLTFTFHRLHQNTWICKMPPSQKQQNQQICFSNNSYFYFCLTGEFFYYKVSLGFKLNFVGLLEQNFSQASFSRNIFLSLLLPHALSTFMFLQNFIQCPCNSL